MCACCHMQASVIRGRMQQRLHVHAQTGRGFHGVLTGFSRVQAVLGGMRAPPPAGVPSRSASTLPVVADEAAAASDAETQSL